LQKVQLHILCKVLNPIWRMDLMIICNAMVQISSQLSSLYALPENWQLRMIPITFHPVTMTGFAKKWSRLAYIVSWDLHFAFSLFANPLDFEGFTRTFRHGMARAKWGNQVEVHNSL